MTKLDIKGIDKAELLAALHNGTRALGMGILHDICRDMTKEEAARILAETGQTRFDYLLGRPLKVDIGGDEMFAGLYDRDAGDGAAERIVSRLRIGKAA